MVQGYGNTDWNKLIGLTENEGPCRLEGDRGERGTGRKD